MADLNDILDDIKSDVTSVTPETIEPVTTPTESTTEEDKEIPGKVFVPVISQEFLNTVNTAKDLRVLKETIDSLKVVDRKLALEVFTMLPDSSELDRSKLTTGPSEINKEIMNRVFTNNIFKTLIDSYNPIYNEIVNAVAEAEKTATTLLSFFSDFKKTTDSKLLELKENKPLIIVKNVTGKNSIINLLEDEISSVAYIDDTAIDYKKYEHTLEQKYRALLNDSTLETLRTIVATDNKKQIVSLFDIFEFTTNSINKLSLIINEFNHYSGSLNRELSDAAYITKDLNGDQNKITQDKLHELTLKYNDIAIKIQHVNTLSSIVNVDNNCFTKAADILSFLD